MHMEWVSLDSAASATRRGWGLACASPRALGLETHRTCVFSGGGDAIEPKTSSFVIECLNQPFVTPRFIDIWAENMNSRQNMMLVGLLKNKKDFFQLLPDKLYIF